MPGNRLKIKVMIFFMIIAVKSLPIYNGFSVNFSPLLNKEDNKAKTFGALFAKIPQELPRRPQEALSQTIFSKTGILGTGNTNQIAKIIFPSRMTALDHNISSWSEANYINIPIIKQPVDDYKILIAEAPPNVKINKINDSKPLIVYIVFPNENSNDANLKIPSIYFVREAKGRIDIHSNLKLDPFIIVDHNRTVTKLKSKEISTYVRFRNKLIDHYNSVH